MSNYIISYINYNIGGKDVIAAKISAEHDERALREIIKKLYPYFVDVDVDELSYDDCIELLDMRDTNHEPRILSIINLDRMSMIYSHYGDDYRCCVENWDE